MNREKAFPAKRFLQRSGFTILAIFFAFQTAVAQIESVKEGDRVKISAPVVKSTTIIGTVSTLENSFLTVAEKDTIFIVDYGSIRSLKVSKGDKLAIGKGALIGGVSGALTVGMISLASNESCDEDEEWCLIEFTGPQAFGIGALLGGLGGFAAGAFIGAFITIDRWEKVPVSVSMNPYPLNYFLSDNRAGLSLKITF